MTPQLERFAFADGGQALTIDRGFGDPWAWTRLPTGTVHSAWHFYSARRPGWSTLTIATRSGSTRIPSDSIPLQVHAFPSIGGSYVRSAGAAPDNPAVTRVAGPRRAPPQLPEAITVPVVTDPYRAPATVVARSERSMAAEESVTVHGLVRSVEATPPVSTRGEQRSTELDLAVLSVNRSAGTARVRATLRDAESGAPIDLTARPGAVVVHDRRLEPDADGRVVATVPLGTGTLTARYRPGPW